MNTLKAHQFVDRETGQVVSEKLFSDPLIRWLYSSVREQVPFVFNALTSKHISKVLGFLNYDSVLGSKITRNHQLLKEWGINYEECLDAKETLDTPRKIFERKIRYWKTRPLPDTSEAVVAPADSRILVGSFSEFSHLLLKGKFFDLEELVSPTKQAWVKLFHKGNFAICRITPDKYHYNHCPVDGRVVDYYELDGKYHSCNPSTVLSVATPLSKNKRVVTVIDTDVPGGTGIGKVAMIEIVALMIGEIVQSYSESKYFAPRSITEGMMLKKGQPKSLYRPGSSTTVLLFEPNRIHFDPVIVANLRHPNAESRYSLDLNNQLVETDVKVRSQIGKAIKPLMDDNYV